MRIADIFILLCIFIPVVAGLVGLFTDPISLSRKALVSFESIQKRHSNFPFTKVFSPIKNILADSPWKTGRAIKQSRNTPHEWVHYELAKQCHRELSLITESHPQKHIIGIYNIFRDVLGEINQFKDIFFLETKKNIEEWISHLEESRERFPFLKTKTSIYEVANDYLKNDIKFDKCMSFFHSPGSVAHEIMQFDARESKLIGSLNKLSGIGAESLPPFDYAKYLHDVCKGMMSELGDISGYGLPCMMEVKMDHKFPPDDNPLLNEIRIYEHNVTDIINREILKVLKEVMLPSINRVSYSDVKDHKLCYIFFKTLDEFSKSPTFDKEFNEWLRETTEEIIILEQILEDKIQEEYAS